MWEIDPLPIYGSVDYWRSLSRQTLAARSTNPERGDFPEGDLDPEPDADEWDDATADEDESYVYTDEDVRRYAEQEADERAAGR